MDNFFALTQVYLSDRELVEKSEQTLRVSDGGYNSEVVSRLLGVQSRWSTIKSQLASVNISGASNLVYACQDFSRRFQSEIGTWISAINAQVNLIAQSIPDAGAYDVDSLIQVGLADLSSTVVAAASMLKSEVEKIRIAFPSLDLQSSVNNKRIVQEYLGSVSDNAAKVALQLNPTRTVLGVDDSLGTMYPISEDIGSTPWLSSVTDARGSLDGHSVYVFADASHNQQRTPNKLSFYNLAARTVSVTVSRLRGCRFFFRTTSGPYIKHVDIAGTLTITQHAGAGMTAHPTIDDGTTAIDGTEVAAKQVQNSTAGSVFDYACFVPSSAATAVLKFAMAANSLVHIELYKIVELTTRQGDRLALQDNLQYVTTSTRLSDVLGGISSGIADRLFQEPAVHEFLKVMRIQTSTRKDSLLSALKSWYDYERNGSFPNRAPGDSADAFDHVEESSVHSLEWWLAGPRAADGTALLTRNTLIELYGRAYNYWMSQLQTIAVDRSLELLYERELA